jgi:mono/diheme cytochrome c family protein
MQRGSTILRALGLVIALAIAAVLVVGATPPPAPPAFGPIVTQGRTLTTADMTNPKPLIPSDIYRGPNPSSNDLATFAWLEFISVVSPANAQNRGFTAGSFAMSGQNPQSLLVWETYQHRSELFPFNSANKPVPPQPWNATPKYVESIMNTSTPYSPGLTNFNNLDETTQIGQNILFFPKTAGSPQPLTDAQVLFEAKVNQYEWQYVNEKYKNVTLPIKLPTGTVEVKAAWRPLSSIQESKRYRYHTANVITYTGSDSNPVAQVQTYALIALHIIHKSRNYPAFTFATFEQVDDCQSPGVGQPCATGLYYVPQYSTVGYSTSKTTSFPPFGKNNVTNPTINFNQNMPTANPNGKSTPLPLGSVSSIAGAKTVSGAVTVPVTQPVATVPGVAQVNQQAYAAMKGIPGFNANFVWQYYKLAGVQAVPTNDDATADFYLANIVVESSQPGIQLFRGQPKILKTGELANARNQANVMDTYTPPQQPLVAYRVTSGGGCQGCHGVAQTQNGFDFSFLFFGRNGGGFSPETIGLPLTPTAAAAGAKHPLSPTAAARLARRRFGWAGSK